MMKFSELWLREWINITLDSKTLLEQITMMGLEVNDVKPVAGLFHNVIIGEVIKCSQHPSVKNLQVVKVSIGDNKRLLNIVCGAPNCRQGIKVAVATVDSLLPNNFKIKTINQYDVLSEGMLCSYFDLGISDDYNNIIELPESAPISTDIYDYLKLNDNIIEINVTPNRADCLSIIGIARDLAVFNKIKLKVPNIIPVVATINDTLPVQVEATEACPRYLGRIVKGINADMLTPLWMKEKLRRCGIRPVDAVVDITNYVLLELGQPLHAFDKDRIDGGIIVRMAKNDETIMLSNGSKAKMNEDTLIIADHNKALAISGICGGMHSGIKAETQNVLLECVFLSPLSIVGRARRYGLDTDASYRYERGVDSALQYTAMERATRLLLDVCGGEAGPIIDITNEASLPKRDSIILHRSKLDRLIGHHISDTQVNDILHRLGCDVTKGQNLWQAISPSWRFDIKIEEDLVEEVARIYGYNNIPNNPVQDSLIMSNHHETELSMKRVKMLLNDKGYQEVITYSFVNPKVQQLIHPGKEALILPNPISSEMSAMRLSLWTGLLGIIIYNQNRQQNRVRIFEAGLRFLPDTQANLGIRQDLMLAGAICGNRYEEHWNLEKTNVDFYDIKGDLESIIDLTGKISGIEFRAEIVPALHPGQSAAMYLEGEHIGYIGAMHPELERKLNLNNHIMMFELEWNKVANRLLPKTQDISRFPMNRRDIAIIVDDNIPVADILAECKKASVNKVVGVNLFDVYRGNGVPKGFKSLAISLLLQSTSRTLEEEEISTIVTKCIEALKVRFQASLRK